jgi:hypothetical protein
MTIYGSTTVCVAVAAGRVGRFLVGGYISPYPPVSYHPHPHVQKGDGCKAESLPNSENTCPTSILVS